MLGAWGLSSAPSLGLNLHLSREEPTAEVT